MVYEYAIFSMNFVATYVLCCLFSCRLFIVDFIYLCTTSLMKNKNKSIETTMTMTMTITIACHKMNQNEMS